MRTGIREEIILRLWFYCPLLPIRTGVIGNIICYRVAHNGLIVANRMYIYVNKQHQNHNSSKHNIYLYPILTIHAFIIALLLTIGCGNDSGIAPANVSDTPRNLVANSISKDEIELVWQDNSSDEDGFNIERKEGPRGVFQVIARVGANITTYRDRSANLSPNTTYYYKVAYYKGNAVSDYSNIASATTLKKELSLRKEFRGIGSDEADFSEPDRTPEEEKGLVPAEECGQREDQDKVTEHICEGLEAKIDIDIASSWINTAVLNSLVYQDTGKSELRSVHGLTETQIEEIKGLAASVQRSFLTLHNVSVIAPADSEEDRASEIDRQANEIIMNADQTLIEMLGPDQYAEFIRWTEEVSGRSVRE